MKTGEEKKRILEILKPFLKKKNVIGRNVWALMYELDVLFNEGCIIKGSISFSDYSTPAFGCCLMLKQIEEIIMKIKFPMHDFSNYTEKDYPFYTITHKYSKFNDFLDSHFQGFHEESDYEKFAQVIVEYLETEGKFYAEIYSYLPNVLNEMDLLEKSGKGWYELLSGNGEHFFRGLIIAKLCNDKNLTHKIKNCDNTFSTSTVLMENGWLPYYEKLKEALKDIKPVYNI